MSRIAGSFIICLNFSSSSALTFPGGFGIMRRDELATSVSDAL